MKLSNRYKILKGPEDWFLVRIGLENFYAYRNLNELIEAFYHYEFNLYNELANNTPLHSINMYLYYKIYQYPRIISFDRRTTKEALKKKLVEYLI